jgi:hypothetical protein
VGRELRPASAVMRLSSISPPSQTPQWSIPGIGALQPCFDRVTIVSSATVGALKHFLPVEALKKVSHSFNITTYDGPDPRLHSRILAVGTQTSNPWSLLAKHARALRQNRITEAEVAFDVGVSSIDDARGTMIKLVKVLAKPRHQRRSVLSVHKPDRKPPEGCVPEPTLYFEDRRSSVKLKCYVRHEKLAAGGGFGELCMRLEWTLAGKRALTRHLGGNQIKHLLTADLNAFLRRNIRLERANHVALGNLFRGIKDLRKQWKDPEKQAFLRLRILADREEAKYGDSQLALLVCQNSPAQIRGYCRELRDGNHRRRRGRPKKQNPSSRTPITDYRINQCFKQIQLIPATCPV